VQLDSIQYLDSSEAAPLMLEYEISFLVFAATSGGGDMVSLDDGLAAREGGRQCAWGGGDVESLDKPGLGVRSRPSHARHRDARPEHTASPSRPARHRSSPGPGGDGAAHWIPPDLEAFL